MQAWFARHRRRGASRWRPAGTTWIASTAVLLFRRLHVKESGDTGEMAFREKTAGDAVMLPRTRRSNCSGRSWWLGPEKPVVGPDGHDIEPLDRDPKFSSEVVNVL